NAIARSNALPVAAPSHSGVIASEAKQSRSSKGALPEPDCFVAALLAMTGKNQDEAAQSAAASTLRASASRSARVSIKVCARPVSAAVRVALARSGPVEDKETGETAILPPPRCGAPSEAEPPHHLGGGALHRAPADDRCNRDDWRGASLQRLAHAGKRQDRP